MKIEAVLFDLNGTITNEIRSLRKYIAKYFIEEKEIDKFINELTIAPGNGSEKYHHVLTNIFKLQYSKEDIAKIHKKLIIQGLEEMELYFIDGFYEFHSKLIKENIKTGVATNSPEHVINIFNRRLGLNKIFGKNIYSSSHVKGSTKPNPAIYFYAIEKISVSPNQCVVFEDTADGIKAARNAGINFIVGVNSSNKPYEIAEANLKINNYNEPNLIEIIKAYK